MLGEVSSHPLRTRQAVWELEDHLVSRAPDNNLEVLSCSLRVPVNHRGGHRDTFLQSGYLAVRALRKLYQLFKKHSTVLLDSINALKEHFKNAGDVENTLEQHFNKQLPLTVFSELVERHRPSLPEEQRQVILQDAHMKRVASVGT